MSSAYVSVNRHEYKWYVVECVRIVNVVVEGEVLAGFRLVLAYSYPRCVGGTDA